MKQRQNELIKKIILEISTHIKRYLCEIMRIYVIH